jgi:hypothetical protein
MDYMFDLDLGPDAQVLAISESPEVGPGVAVVDLNGQGMLYSALVWKYARGVVTSHSGSSGLGWTLTDGMLHVTGELASDDIAEAVIHCPGAEPTRYRVAPNARGFYAAVFELAADQWEAAIVEVEHRHT